MRDGAKLLKRPQYAKEYVLAMVEKYMHDVKYGDESKNISPHPPIVKECYLMNGWTEKNIRLLREYDNDIDEAFETLENAREVEIEVGMMTGKIPQIPAIFALKQLGWSDSPKATSNTEVENLAPLADMINGKKPRKKAGRDS